MKWAMVSLLPDFTKKYKIKEAEKSKPSMRNSNQDTCLELDTITFVLERLVFDKIVPKILN